MEERKGLIYIIRNNINNKVYIGQTTRTMETRFKQHIYDSNKLNTHIYKAMRKYGVDNFYVELIEDNIPSEELDNKEVMYIKNFDSYYNGYNSTLGGEGGSTFIKDEKKLEEFKSMFYKGYSQELMGEHFGVTKLTIFNTIKALNLKRNFKETKKIVKVKYYTIIECLNKEYLNELVNYYSNKQILEIFGVTQETFNKVYRHFNVTSKTTKEVRTNYIKELIKTMTPLEISRYMNYSHGRVYEIINKLDNK